MVEGGVQAGVAHARAGQLGGGAEGLGVGHRHVLVFLSRGERREFSFCFWAKNYKERREHKQETENKSKQKNKVI